MTVLALLSAKHSPGVTTAAVAFAAALASEAHPIVVEADPAGGDIAARCGLALEPGLVTLAAAGRHPASPLELFGHAQPLPAGGSVVVGPPSPDTAIPAIAAVARRLGLAAEATAHPVIVDCGRWSAGSPVAPVMESASAVLVVVEPTISGVAHTGGRLDSIRFSCRAPVTLLVAGDRPYPPDEVGEALGLPVAGVLAQDGRGTAGIYGGGAPAGARRSYLVRSARSALERVAALLELPAGAAS